MNRYENYNYKGDTNIFVKVIKIFQNEGIFQLLKKTFYFLERKLFYPTQYLFYKRKTKYFVLDSKTYKYFYHPYNHTWANERAVEVAFCIEIINNVLDKSLMLEIGNVLSNYRTNNWVVVDKYDKSGVSINTDIVDFSPKEKYDLIVSISTIEHIGFDDYPKSKEKVLFAIEHIKNNLLSEGGRLIVTFPIGYNTNLDNYLFENKLKLSKAYFLKRINKSNNWVQVNNVSDLKGIQYNKPFPYANGIVIGFINKD